MNEFSIMITTDKANKNKKSWPRAIFSIFSMMKGQALTLIISNLLAEGSFIFRQIFCFSKAEKEWDLSGLAYANGYLR